MDYKISGCDFTRSSTTLFPTREVWEDDIIDLVRASMQIFTKLDGAVGRSIFSEQVHNATRPM